MLSQSVTRLSVTTRHCVKKAKHIVEVISPPDTPISLVSEN